MASSYCGEPLFIIDQDDNHNLDQNRIYTNSIPTSHDDNNGDSFVCNTFPLINFDNSFSQSSSTPSPKIANDETDQSRLNRRLSNLEITIEQLFELRSPNAILKEKLSFADELILDISRESSPRSLADEWRRKVALWWRRFAEIFSRSNIDFDSQNRSNSNPRMQDAQTSEQQFVGWQPLQYSNRSNDEIGNRFDCTWQFDLSKKSTSNFVRSQAPQQPILSLPDPAFRGSNLALIFPQSTNQSSQSPFYYSPMRTSDQNGNNQIISSSTSPSSVESSSVIREQWISIFEQLLNDGTRCADDDNSNSNSMNQNGILALQRLLATVAQMIKLIIPFVGDDHFLLRISALAIDRLPRAKRAKFDQLYQRKTLFNLMQFLRKEIVAYCEQRTNFGEDDGDDNLIIAGNHSLCCIYCRRFGHRVVDCPVKASRLCFKCYRFGHTLKCCPNPSLINIK